MRYMTIKRFAEESGYTEKAIREKIRPGGPWRVNEHFKIAPDGRIMIDTHHIDQWIERSTRTTAGRGIDRQPDEPR